MPERKWLVDGEHVLAVTDDEVRDALAEATLLLDRVGGGLVVSAVRSVVGKDHQGEDLYMTTGLAFKWHSYGGPAVDQANGSEPAQEAPEPAQA